MKSANSRLRLWAVVLGVASLVLCLRVCGQDVGGSPPGLTNGLGFQQAGRTFKGFRVESAAEFERIKQYHQQRLVEGRITHRFTTASGELIHCIEIESQPAAKRAGLLPGDIKLVPEVLPGGAWSIEAGRGSGPAEFGMDGSLDDEGNMRRCPVGSVPVLIPSLQDLCRFRRLEDRFRKYPGATNTGPGTPRGTARHAPVPPGQMQAPSAIGHEYAETYAFLDHQGEQADFNVWRPAVEQTYEFSLSQLWVCRWSGTNVQTVETGWQVFDGLYGDWNPHLFIYFTTHSYDAGYPGAYNLDGGYFVQTDSSVIIGGSLAGLVSTIGGTQQSVTLMFYRDQGGNHNWWLKYGNIWVGYYPNSLFSSWGIADKGGEIEYGGEIVNTATGGRHSTTGMGSGRFPSEGWEASAFIKRIQYVDMNYAWQNATSLTRFVSNPSYYDLSLYSTNDSNWAQYFYFGGPGFLPCSISQFAVNSLSGNVGSSFTISYSVSDSGGGGLAGAQLWRASVDGTSIDSSWQAVGSPVVLSGNSWSGSITDTPTTAGNYWYGMHVWDSAGNSATERLAGLAPIEVSVLSSSMVSVTVQPSVSGLSFTVDGTAYTSAQTFSWVSGSSHPIATSSPQAGATGIRYVWSGWSDGGAISHSVAPTRGAAYTASFTTQYYLAMSAAVGGSVSPTSDWYGSGAVADINATPARGYSFSGWAGAGAGSYSGSSVSASVTMNGPVSETASFAVNPGNVSVTAQGNPSGASFTVDGIGYASRQSFSWTSGSSHPIATASPQSGGPGIQYIWSNWSDGGAMSHTVAPTSGTTFTANFATQYRLDRS